MSEYLPAEQALLHSVSNVIPVAVDHLPAEQRLLHSLSAWIPVAVDHLPAEQSLHCDNAVNPI